MISRLQGQKAHVYQVKLVKTALSQPRFGSADVPHGAAPSMEEFAANHLITLNYHHVVGIVESLYPDLALNAALALDQQQLLSVTSAMAEEEAIQAGEVVADTRVFHAQSIIAKLEKPFQGTPIVLPKLPRMYLFLGLAKGYLDQAPEAMADYQRAIDAIPVLTEGFRLADFRQDLTPFDVAAYRYADSIFEKADDAQKDTPEFYFYRGMSRLLGAESQKAHTEGMLDLVNAQRKFRGMNADFSQSPLCLKLIKLLQKH